MRAMNHSLVKTRFAPSPTGLIHLGNVRTALFNALYARSQRGVFLLRFEGTDLERSRGEYILALMEDLHWLGLDWQEGPEADDGHGPYAQSQRDDIYQRYFAELEAGGYAYPCFCSQRELELSRKTQLASGRPRVTPAPARSSVATSGRNVSTKAYALLCASASTTVRWCASTIWCAGRRLLPPTISATSSFVALKGPRHSFSAMPSTTRLWK